MKHLILAFSSFLFLCSELLPSTAEPAKADVLVYGATAAGITAAVQTARMGRTVIIVEPGRFIGGMTAGGLGATDTGSPLATGGIAREFYHNLYNHYQNPEVWTRGETRADYAPKHRLAISEPLQLHWFFEPSAAKTQLQKLLDNPLITLVLNCPLDRSGNGVRKEGASIIEISSTDGRRFAAKRFIDATYEGDLMAAAGASFIIGREPNSRYLETLNGIRFYSPGRTSHVDPFVKAGDPTSGLLPRILPKTPGVEGEGDGLTQAYNFRLCLTDSPENLRKFEKPEGYNPLEYEIVLRHILGTPGIRPGNGPGSGILTLTPMPNRKTDSNNNNRFSTDYVGGSWNWPAASYAEREKILAEHKLYTQGLLWFLVNDTRVPESIRKEINRWGLAKDEFTDNDNWPTQLYVREARRMIGEYVVTEHDCTRERIVDDPIALASYAMDSHIVSLFVDENNQLRIDGGFFKGVSPYPVSYRAILPKRSECDNLLVPVCLSSSHAAYGSMRMEPIFMMLAQSAATAAVLSIEHNVIPAQLRYPLLRDRLLADGQILSAPAKPKKAATTQIQGATEGKTEAAIARLDALGLLADAGYWRENAKPGSKCDGARVGQLIIAVVSTKKKVSSINEACDILKKRKTIERTEYWRQNAIAGKTCSGSQVAALLIRMDALASKKQ